MTKKLQNFEKLLHMEKKRKLKPIYHGIAGTEKSDFFTSNLEVSRGCQEMKPLYEQKFRSFFSRFLVVSVDFFLLSENIP